MSSTDLRQPNLGPLRAAAEGAELSQATSGSSAQMDTASQTAICL
jgi:hypothetical protein